MQQQGAATWYRDTRLRDVAPAFSQRYQRADHPLRPSLGWLGQILPFAEQDNLYKQSVTEFASGSHPVGGPHATLQTYVDLFACPTDPRYGEAEFTHGNRLVATSAFAARTTKPGTGYSLRIQGLVQTI